MPYEPNGPGWKQGATSADAAAKIAPRAETLRQMAHIVSALCAHQRGVRFLRRARN